MSSIPLQQYNLVISAIYHPVLSDLSRSSSATAVLLPQYQNNRWSNAILTLYVSIARTCALNEPFLMQIRHLQLSGHTCAPPTVGCFIYTSVFTGSWACFVYYTCIAHPMERTNFQFPKCPRESTIG